MASNQHVDKAQIKFDRVLLIIDSKTIQYGESLPPQNLSLPWGLFQDRSRMCIRTLHSFVESQAPENDV